VRRGAGPSLSAPSLTRSLCSMLFLTKENDFAGEEQAITPAELTEHIAAM